MWMERSPAGREICELEGDAGPIRSRGRQIESLGIKMIDSAAFLKSLADQTSGQRGKAVEKLQEIVGDTHEELRRAGQLYKPTGPILVTYAQALDDVQPQLNRIVARCIELWHAYDAAPGFLDGQRPAFPAVEDGSPEADAEERADRAKAAKHQAFVEEAGAFDRQYDTWETAFDTAVSGITDVVDGKIKDSPWDDLDGFVAGTIQVLKVVGMIVAIAAIVIGGPIFAAIGAVVGLVTLALTVYQAIRADTGWDQVIWAAVGCIPFGSAGKLFQNGKRLEFLGDIVSKSNFAKWAGEGRSLRSLFTGAGGGWRGLLAAGKGNYLAHNPMGPGDLISRLMLGKDTTALTDLAGKLANGPGKGAAAYEFVYMLASGPWKLGDNIAKWTGNADSGPSKHFPLVGALL